MRNLIKSGPWIIAAFVYIIFTYHFDDSICMFHYIPSANCALGYYTFINQINCTLEAMPNDMS